MKRYIGFNQSTGDLLAIPIAAGIALGRIGCFLTGLADNTYGTPTSLPWAVDFGDGIPRHPTQLYEILFLVILIAILVRLQHSISELTTNDERPTTPLRPGDVFRLFMIAYLTFRLFCDFIKPYPRIFLGLGTIQWACIVGLLYYSRDILRWAGLLSEGDS